VVRCRCVGGVGVRCRCVGRVGGVGGVCGFSGERVV